MRGSDLDPTDVQILHRRTAPTQLQIRFWHLNPRPQVVRIRALYDGILKLLWGALWSLVVPHSFQPVPHSASAAVLLQMVALGQVAEMLLEGVATGSSQFDGIHHRDAAVLSGEFHDL